MVLICHELFDLLLTALELEHNLAVSLSNSLAVVALSSATVLKGLFTPLKCRFEVSVLRLVIVLHAHRQGGLPLLVLFERLLDYHLLGCAEHDKLLAKGLVAPADYFHSFSEMLAISSIFDRQFLVEHL